MEELLLLIIILAPIFIIISMSEKKEKEKILSDNQYERELKKTYSKYTFNQLQDEINNIQDDYDDLYRKAVKLYEKKGDKSAPSFEVPYEILGYMYEINSALAIKYSVISDLLNSVHNYTKEEINDFPTIISSLNYEENNVINEIEFTAKLIIGERLFLTKDGFILLYDESVTEVLPHLGECSNIIFFYEIKKLSKKNDSIVITYNNRSVLLKDIKETITNKYREDNDSIIFELKSDNTELAFETINKAYKDYLKRNKEKSK